MQTLFITATGRDKGKTAFTVGLLSVLEEAVGDIGYMKPIGQRYVVHQGVKIDEDVELIQSVYNFPHPVEDMSPVVIDKGFTSENISGAHADELAARIMGAYNTLKDGKKVMVLEGSGKTSVGEVFGLSNMKIAEMLGASVIVIAEGGIGNTIDECMLNKAYIDTYDVDFRGVVINKVFQSKYDKIRTITGSGLRHLGMECLGVIPYESMLSQPTLNFFLDEYRGLELLTGDRAGDERLKRKVKKVVVGAMTPHQALKYLRGGELLITGGDREDVLIATLCRTAMNINKDPESVISGIVATGEVQPHQSIIETAERLNVLIFHTCDDTYTATSRIKSLNVKIRPEDTRKIRCLAGLIKEHIDLDRLL